MTDHAASDLIPTPSRPRAVIVGGGPAGLIAAERLAQAGWNVDLYDRMPTVGRKLLMAGRGGLNLTHSEPIERFLPRYGAARERLKPLIARFGPEALRAWADELGQGTFVGTSGRVFPHALKASPLLRAWLGRLTTLGARFHTRRRWLGWSANGELRFCSPQGEEVAARPDATLLALGGASWPGLGSDGAWTDILAARGVEIRPLQPANCGFEAKWSEVFRSRFAGEPLKNISVRFGDRQVRGEAVISAYGLEGGAIYALSGRIRDEILERGRATIRLDLRPDSSQAELAKRLVRRRQGDSVSSWLRRAAGLPPAAVSLLRESYGIALPSAATDIARAIKDVRLDLTGIPPIARAISSAGGVAWSQVGPDLQLRKLPGVFVAGEMLSWEAPTGGYLLQAVFASGVAAAEGMMAAVGRAAEPG